MTTETYLEIRDAVKAEIITLTSVHTANKLTLKFNARYCDSNSAKFDSSKLPLPRNPRPLLYSDFWENSELILTCLHIFYNRLRRRRPHTSRDDEFVSTHTYVKVEQLFSETE